MENIASHNVSLLVMNDAAILRDNDILTPEDAVTPASRVYYSLQCMYLFPGERERHLRLFEEYISAFVDAVPSVRGLASEMVLLVSQGDYYPALKSARKLIEHEQKVLTHVQERLGQELRDATDRR
ncbi:MAG: flagellar biosynthesis repressor FlbT [Magnetospirillum sp. WYHS-4]